MRRESYSTPGTLRLDLSVPSGEIDVRTGEGTETEVQLEPLRDNDATRAAVEDARIQLRDRGSEGQELVVEVRDQRGFGLFTRGVEVRLAVRCPHGAHLKSQGASADLQALGRYASAEVKTASGDVHVEQIEGDAGVKAASGDVDLGRIGGELRVDSASGDVQVQAIGGRGTIRTASGDVVVRDGASALTVQTASGDQRLEGVSEGEVTLQSASGDVYVAIRRGSKLWVDARSMSGDTSSELEMEDVPPEGEGPLVELRATTMSGDVHVARAPARSELTA